MTEIGEGELSWSSYWYAPPVTIAVMGAHAVGKTMLIEQMVSNGGHTPSDTRTARCTVLYANQLYDVQIIDVPAVTCTYFPKNSLDEWDMCGGQRVRSANAYLLVYAVGDELARTFDVCAQLSRQIREHRPNAPIVVCSNKCDVLRGTGDNELGQLVNTVHKQWHCVHVRASAQWNWHVNELLQQCIKLIDAAPPDDVTSSVGSSVVRPASTTSKRCVKRCMRCAIQ